MTSSSQPSSPFYELIQTGLDADAATRTTALNIGSASNCIFQVRGASGTHGTHILTLECSVDNINWNPISGATVTGEGVKGEITVASEWISALVTTLEGGASTVDVIIQAK